MTLTIANRRRSTAILLLAFALVGALVLWRATAIRAEQPAAPSATNSALHALSSASATDRANAVKTMRVTKDVTAVPALIDHLDDPDQAVGLYIAQTLGELAGADDYGELRAALHSTDPNVKWRAAYVLGAQRDRGAVEALAGNLRDPNIMVQQTSAEALAHIGGSKALEALTGALGSPSASVAHAAMSALESAGEDAVQALSAATTSNNALARLNAVTVLGYISSPSAAPALQLSLVDPDPQVRAEAEWALAQVGQVAGR